MSAKTLSYKIEETPGYAQLHGFVEVHGAVSEVTLTTPTGGLARPEITDLSNGFGAFKKTMGPLAVAMALDGNATFHSAPIRGSSRKPWQDIFDASRVHLDTHTAIFDYFASSKELRNLPNGHALSMTHRNNAGHSYGGEIATSDALEHPDEVKNVVLINAVGLEKPGKLKYVKRIPKFTSQELWPFILHAGPDFTPEDGWRALEHFFVDPLQTVGEAVACHRADNRRRLPILTSHNIGVAVLAGSKDNLTPSGPMKKYAKPLADHFAEMPTDHLGPQRYPDIVSYFVSAALDKLDTRHQPDLEVRNGIDLLAG